MQAVEAARPSRLICAAITSHRTPMRKLTWKAPPRNRQHSQLDVHQAKQLKAETNCKSVDRSRRPKTAITLNRIGTTVLNPLPEKSGLEEIATECTALAVAAVL